MTRIVTPRLILRRASWHDVDALHAVFSDPECMRYWSTEPHGTLADTRAWIGSMLTAQTRDDVIVELDGRAIGKFGAWRRPEIGFIFHRRTWGRGYAFEAGEAFMRHAFSRSADHLTADVDPRNGPSIRLLGRLGFTETHREAHTFYIGEQWCDSAYFRCDAPVVSWPNRQD